MYKYNRQCVRLSHFIWRFTPFTHRNFHRESDD